MLYAGHVRRFEGVIPLFNLMEVKDYPCKGVVARRSLKAAWSKIAARCKSFESGRAEFLAEGPLDIHKAGKSTSRVVRFFELELRGLVSRHWLVVVVACRL